MAKKGTKGMQQAKAEVEPQPKGPTLEERVTAIEVKLRKYFGV